MTDSKQVGESIKAKADAEAARAEAEDETIEPEPAPEPVEPDEDEEAEAETAEPEPEPEPAGRKQKSPQERFETAFSAFRKKAADIFEVPVQEVVPAPHPGVVGIMLPGYAEPRTHENYTQCTTCNGLGEVLTGANTGKHENDWHACPDGRCKGRGYWQKASSVEQAPMTGPLAVGQPSEPNGEYAEAPAWMGDPNLAPQAG